MPLTVLALLLSLSAGSKAHAADHEVRGRVFYDKLNHRDPSFYFHSTSTEKDGKKTVTAVYSDKEGKELVREESYFEGDQLIRSVYRQNQVNEQGEVAMKDGKAHFTFTDHGGTETDSEDIVPNMILGGMIATHVNKHWDELLKGESVKVRYMAIERLETVGFKFFKDKERVLNGRPVVDLLMKPSSFIIAAVVDPIRISFSKDEPHIVLEVTGRTPIRWPRIQPPQSRKDWKAIDARIEFDPPKALAEAAPEPVAAPAAEPPAPDPAPVPPAPAKKKASKKTRAK